MQINWCEKTLGIIRLMRVQQYYKNLIILVGIFFAGELFNFSLYPRIFFGFLILCLTSSIIYILNDIRDKEADTFHPEKKKSRPLASGILSVKFAWILVILLILFIGYIAILFADVFSLMLGLMLANGLLYNYFLKDIAFADIISLSTIYIWRALAGCVLIDVTISPWLTIAVFLTALFLATGKRIADLSLMGKKSANNHKKTYNEYSADLLDKFLIIIATSLFVVYTLYCVLGPTESDSILDLKNNLLIYSTPIALFLIFRFIYIIKFKPEIARKAHKLIHDKEMLIAGIFFGLLILSIFYLNLDGVNFLKF